MGSDAVLILVPLGGIFGWIVKMVLRHRERMAMIERGMNPDALEAGAEGIESGEHRALRAGKPQ